VFGIIQHENGHQVKIWEFDRERSEHVQATRNNQPFLAGYPIPREIPVHWDIKKALEGAECVVFAVPSQTLTPVVDIVAHVKSECTCYLNLVKGIDQQTLKRPSEIIQQGLGEHNAIFTLSGPCIANEIVRGEPTAAVIVGTDECGTARLQQALATETFRIYQGDDVIGAELGAATKNVIALGCGISDGLGYGTNAKGALVTRGIVEIQRLGVRMGARAGTFWGLSGLGDLVTTSFSNESRNHRCGVCIGEGKPLEQILREMVMVAEGIPTARAIKRLASRYGVDMPICDSVYGIVYEMKLPKQAIQELMSRPLRHE
jgi:glycerol-3-phosphate dehydrogenase (NAD(P)+)